MWCLIVIRAKVHLSIFKLQKVIEFHTLHVLLKSPHMEVNDVSNIISRAVMHCCVILFYVIIEENYLNFCKC